jgi:hypothetical protein
VIALNAAQQAAIDARSKIVTWLFDLTLTDDSTRRLSTKSTTHGGQDYSGAVIDWQGVTMRRSQSETGIVAPADISLTIMADDLTIADLDGAALTVRLVVDGGNGPVEIRAWRYVVTGIQPAYGTIKLTAQSFVTSALSGSWPRSATALAAFPEADVRDDGYCVPVTFGQAFIPLRSVLSSGQRHYLLGPAGPSYSINTVRAPRSSGATTEWSAGSYSMPQSSQGAYRTFRPIVADADSNGTPDSQGLWQTGGRYLDPLVQFSRSDTAGLTNPADVIEYILRDMGLGDSDIDTDAFAVANATFESWGLEWNFGIWTKQDRQKLLAQLLTACASTLDVGDRVGLRVMGGSVGSIDTGDVIRKGGSGKGAAGSFGYLAKMPARSSSGYIGWRQPGEPEDELMRVLIDIGAGTDSPSLASTALGMIQDADHAQRIGEIHYRRSLTGKSAISATLSSPWCTLEPGDTLTVAATQYGGPYEIEVDTVVISRDLTCRIQGTRYSAPIPSFADLSYSSISLATDSTSMSQVWAVPLSGPDSGTGLNSLAGRIKIGPDIVLDGGAGKITVPQLSSISADIGEIVAGLLRSNDGLRYLDLDATGTDPFLVCGSGLTLRADGSADFAGNITSAEIEAAVFKTEALRLTNEHGAICLPGARYGPSTLVDAGGSPYEEHMTGLGTGSWTFNPGNTMTSLYTSSWSPATNKERMRFFSDFGEAYFEASFIVRTGKIDTLRMSIIQCIRTDSVVPFPPGATGTASSRYADPAPFTKVGSERVWTNIDTTAHGAKKITIGGRLEYIYSTPAHIWLGIYGLATGAYGVNGEILLDTFTFRTYVKNL